jgi:7-cyano-7-deazaguanine synthase
MSKIAVVGLSGGMDSATLLGYLLNQGFEVHCCSFVYGSKHNPFENKAAVDIVKYYTDKHASIKHHQFDLTSIMGGFNSALMASGEAIPEGHYNDENMKKTVVPGRNTIFASIMAGLAESIGARIVSLGVHSGDHHIYPDCRPEFVESLKETIRISTEGSVTITAPFSDDDKESILKRGYAYHPAVPYHLTRTCYKAQEKSCGKCGSCAERLEAFANLGITDPISYDI